MQSQDGKMYMADVAQKPASALWGAAFELHALKKVGENDLHVISVEIKKCF